VVEFATELANTSEVQGAEMISDAEFSTPKKNKTPQSNSKQNPQHPRIAERKFTADNPTPKKCRER
jgi:hypothetical protein